MSMVATLPSLAAHLEATSIPNEPVWRLSVERYHAMIRVGILTDDDPVELLEGLLIAKVRKTPQHSCSTRLVRCGLESLIRDGHFAESHGAVTTDDNEPEPDVLVVRGGMRDYVNHHPHASDCALVVEVADATLARDRGIKKRIYSRAAICRYWIVNLVDRQVEVHTDPNGPANTSAYRHCYVYGPTESVPVVIDGQDIGRLTVADLLP